MFRNVNTRTIDRVVQRRPTDPGFGIHLRAKVEQLICLLRKYRTPLAEVMKRLHLLLSRIGGVHIGTRF